jgi:hypothetical protein
MRHYSSRIIRGRQRKHMEGTIEFLQHRKKMQNDSPGSEPSILISDAQMLIDKYMGKGTHYDNILIGWRTCSSGKRL